MNHTLVVYRITTLRRSGWSERQIAQHLNETGTKTPSARLWIKQGVIQTRWEKHLAMMIGKHRAVGVWWFFGGTVSLGDALVCSLLGFVGF
jgi:hypothetical protein